MIVVYLNLLYLALICFAMHCIALCCHAMFCFALHCIALHCIGLLCFTSFALLCIALLCFALPTKQCQSIFLTARQRQGFVFDIFEIFDFCLWGEEPGSGGPRNPWGSHPQGTRGTDPPIQATHCFGTQ